eukprot:m.37611 g.37611  ORF g.37611 m.37611 type:complete len:449 (-) comp6747_c0_seq3:323-1669(-)
MATDSHCCMSLRYVLLLVILSQLCSILVIIHSSSELSSDVSSYLIGRTGGEVEEKISPSKAFVSPSLQHTLAAEGVEGVFAMAEPHGEYLVVKEAIVGGRYRVMMLQEAQNQAMKKNTGKNGHDETTSEGSHGLTICTQASLDGVKEIAMQAHAFDGPISASIFIEEDIGTAISYLARLLQCSYIMNVAFHLVFQNDKDAYSVMASDRVDEVEKITCDDLPKLFASSHENYNHIFPFPNNALRNIAVKAALTEYVMVLDVDIVPSSGLNQELLRAARLMVSNEIANTVFIIPTFEVVQENILPQSRTDVLRWIEVKKAQPFYKDLCWKCQKHTRFDVWQGNHDSKLLYEVHWEDAFEPFYGIHRNGFIPYDERFKQYGFNRISQVCETHVAGYRFKVLYNGFAMHQGFKVRGKFHPTKEAEMKRNKALYQEFQKELVLKYPNSPRRCT